MGIEEAVKEAMDKAAHEHVENVILLMAQYNVFVVKAKDKYCYDCILNQYNSRPCSNSIMPLHDAIMLCNVYSKYNSNCEHDNVRFTTKEFIKDEKIGEPTLEFYNKLTELSKKAYDDIQSIEKFADSAVIVHV